METAAKYDQPPSRWWGNRGDWLEKDYVLTLGYTIYKDGLNELGFPYNLTRHPDNDGWFEAETVTDHAVAAYEQYGRDNPKPGVGERVIVRYTRPADLPLPAVGELLHQPEDDKSDPGQTE